MINTYCLGWLRQEVNQYLNVPIEIVHSLDERMRCLLGYSTHDMQGGPLGKYFGSDTSFVDTGTYAKLYRSRPDEAQGEN